MVDAAALLRHDALKGLDAEHRALVTELAGRLNGKSAAEALPVFASFGKRAANLRPLTKTEQSGLAAAFLASLEPKERAGYERALKLLGAI